MPTEIPHPMPVGLGNQVNIRLQDRPLQRLDDDARSVIRQLVADAYALGFHEGGLSRARAAEVDESLNRDNRPTISDQSFTVRPQKEAARG